MSAHKPSPPLSRSTVTHMIQSLTEKAVGLNLSVAYYCARRFDNAIEGSDSIEVSCLRGTVSNALIVADGDNTLESSRRLPARCSGKKA